MVHDAFCVYSHVTGIWLMVGVGPCLRCWKHSERVFWRVGFSGVECPFSLGIGCRSSSAILILLLCWSNHLRLKSWTGHRCHSQEQREKKQERQRNKIDVRRKPWGWIGFLLMNPSCPGDRTRGFWGHFLPPRVLSEYFHAILLNTWITYPALNFHICFSSKGHSYEKV